MARSMTSKITLFIASIAMSACIMFGLALPASALESDASDSPDALVAAQSLATAARTSLKNLSGTVDKCVAGNGSSYYTPSAQFTFKIAGLPADAYVTLVSDSNKKGYSYVSNVAAGKVTLYVSGVGTHKIRLSALGKTFTCKAVLRVLNVKKTSNIKHTGGLVAYPGYRSALKVAATGVKAPKAKWWTSNKRVVTVNKKGVVKAKRKGRAYVKAKYKGATVKVLVEVTSRSAYEAVRNAFYDVDQNITYSQAYRMSEGYRDCSSFVSRCYWDETQGRHIFAIGDWAKSWALTAAGQAQWLDQQGKCIAWGAVSAKKLRPGDTVYYKTGYAGENTEWLGIDHAALYVGNGCLAQTHGGGGKDLGITPYYEGQAGCMFIGRPCP